MLDHTLLLQKIECIGFKESVIKWFQSYLSNRKPFMTLEDFFSDAGLINCGVPQESILDPLLFLIYIYLYADDACIFYQDHDVEKIKEKSYKKNFRHSMNGL